MGKLWWYAYSLKQFVYQFLRVDVIRWCVAAVRYVYYVSIRRRLRAIEPATGNMGTNTVFHNQRMLERWKDLAISRSHLLVYPLSAIRVSKSIPMLCIGPRSEGELLNLLGMGFRNIRGIDLISYSPWIDLGDMHAMPYTDNSFGIVIMGWVLAYSREKRKAAKEVLRVVQNGGLVAVGSEDRKETAEELAAISGYEVANEERLTSVAAILDLFAPHVDHVYFSHDRPREPRQKWQLLVIFSVKK